MSIQAPTRLLPALALVAAIPIASCDRSPTGPTRDAAPAAIEPGVVEPTRSNLSPTAALLTFAIEDPVDDNTGPIDVLRMEMDFDPATGDYEIRLDAHPTSPFLGEFRVNVNLLNVDDGTPFADAGNDFVLAAGSERLLLSGNSASLTGWAEGDEVSTDSLCNMGPDPRFSCSSFDVPNPPGVSLFRTSVLDSDFSFLTNEDVVAFADYAQRAAIQSLTPQARLVRLGEDVLDLEAAGTLNEGQADGLTDKLVEAALKLFAGRERAAIQQLRAFMRQVRGLVPAHLSEAEGELLREQARVLIAQIEDPDDPPDEDALPPAIVSQPMDATVLAGETASFEIEASGAEPLSYQWRRDGVDIPGANADSYELAAATRADSGVAFSVLVSNAAGEVESDPAVLEVVGVTVFGLSGFRPIYPAGLNDLTGIRYRVQVVENESQSLRLIFGFNRLHTPGAAFNYLIETNTYSGRLEFTDGGCTTWPLLGTYHETESSLRLAIPDYAYHFGQQPGLTTGIRTHNPTDYPVQSYLIDDIPDLHKSDAISQLDMDGLESLVTLERGGTLTDVSDFERCGRPLEPRVYRTWRVTVETTGAPDVVAEFVLPDEGARYLTVNEAMNFLSEFIHGGGAFTVQYWGLDFTRESDPVWRPVERFVSQERYDGNGRDFGVRIVESGGEQRIEISNRAGREYIRAGLEFTID